MEEKNPVKEILFDYINKNENNFKKLISKNKYDEIISDIASNCYDNIVIMDKKEESLGVLATGILHYLLTNALIPSQRKVKINGVEIDLVIPDIKTLQKDPKMALIICIPKTRDQKSIEKKVQALQNIQSEKDNIWLVLSEHLPLDNKTFVISKENSNFTKIIFEIAQFTNIYGNSKFKILRI